MHTNQKYNRAMRDGFMVKPSKPQATRSSIASKRQTKKMSQVGSSTLQR